MKWLLWIVVAVVVLVALVAVVGALLPRRHVAAVRLTLAQPIDRVFEVISDVPGGTAWRADLTKVEILAPPDGSGGRPQRWKETTGFGDVIMALDESTPPSRLVIRIDDPDQPFSGRWIYELEQEAGTGVETAGTVLTITEDAEVSNVFFRFMSRFLFGHYRTLETYARDLARRFGESSQPLRVAERG